MSMNKQAYDRRDFLRYVGGGLAAAIALALFGCEETDLDNPPNSTVPPAGGATNPPSGTPTPTTGATNTPLPRTPTFTDLSGAISNNHGHTVTLSAQNLETGRGAILLLTLGSGHTHTVSFSDKAVEAIAAGTSVSEDSSVSVGHSHRVSF